MSVSNHFIAFYNYHPDIFYAVSRESGDTEQYIFHAASRKSKIVPSLTGNSEIVNAASSQLLPQGHNPTIGLLLCADTDDVAHYSVLNGNDQLFAAKYLTYMPTSEELRREIEQQKEFFRLQQGND